MLVNNTHKKVETSIAERNQTFAVKDPAIIFDILSRYNSKGKP